MQLTFYGAAQTVTGSKHLITLNSGKRVLLDCGLFQGMGHETADLNMHLGFEPGIVDSLILSHAHIDHSGNIPFLVKNGFKGKIYCSDATFDLCSIMLMDSAHIHMQDVKYANKRRAKQGRQTIKPLYTVYDVVASLKQFQIIEMQQWNKLYDDFEFMFTDAGHILGSVAINMRIKEDGAIKNLFYSGDIGRTNDIILKNPQPFPQADYIICESTYGDRLHEDIVGAENALHKIIVETCLKRKGKVIIPAFSLGRTQEVVYAIDRMVTTGKLPMLNVYVDSPLAVSATEIMKKHPEFFNPEILEYMKLDSDPFGFDKLQYITDVEESKALNNSDEPCIIIAASGMTDAGRIKHHIKNNIGDDRNSILIIGYLPADSLGGKLLAGKKEVKIFGDLFNVKASIYKIDAYSAHADYNEMLHYLSCQDKEKVKGVFLVHGDLDVQLNWKKTLIENGFNNVSIPERGETVDV